jgi:hypothetical protein
LKNSKRRKNNASKSNPSGEFFKDLHPASLKKMLRGNPPDWNVQFDESSIEYAALIQAAQSNKTILGKRPNPINCPTAVKFVNKF